MYRCPHCGELAISAWSQFSAPFNTTTTCPACKNEVKVKRKMSNYLVALYLIAMPILAYIFAYPYDSSAAFVGLVAVAIVPIRSAAYEEVAL